MNPKQIDPLENLSTEELQRALEYAERKQRERREARGTARDFNPVPIWLDNEDAASALARYRAEHPEQEGEVRDYIFVSWSGRPEQPAEMEAPTLDEPFVPQDTPPRICEEDIFPAAEESVPPPQAVEEMPVDSAIKYFRDHPAWKN
jgi:hypothetical protein